MNDTPGSEHASDERDFAGAVDDVLDKVAEHQAVAEEIAERKKSRSRTPVLLVCGVLIILVALFDVWALTRPPEGLPPDEARADLRAEVGYVAEEVQAYLAAEGRLPSADEIQDVLDEGLRYVVVGEGRFRVTAVDGDLVETYDSSMPLDAWLAEAQGGSR